MRIIGPSYRGFWLCFLQSSGISKLPVTWDPTIESSCPSFSIPWNRKQRGFLAGSFCTSWVDGWWSSDALVRSGTEWMRRRGANLVGCQGRCNLWDLFVLFWSLFDRGFHGSWYMYLDLHEWLMFITLLYVYIFKSTVWIFGSGTDFSLGVGNSCESNYGSLEVDLVWGCFNTPSWNTAWKNAFNKRI